MQCSVCESEVRYIDNMFVCEEGHTFKHEFEVSEHTGAFRASRKVKALQPKIVEKKMFPKKYTRLLLFTCVFYESQKFFGLESDALFRLYISLIKHKGREITNDYRLVSPPGLHAIIYLTKRWEHERNYKAVFANEYMRYVRLFPYKKHVAFFSKEINKQSLKCISMSIDRGSDHLNHMYNVLFKINLLLANEDLDPAQKDAIRKMTTFQKNDMRIFFAYLDSILDSFCMPKSASLMFYFKKFVYSNCVDGIMFIPEIEICSFLYEYMMRFKIAINYEEAAKRVLEKLNAFENEQFLTPGLSASIERHRSTNAPVMESLYKTSDGYARRNLKEFIADYLGINVHNFDEIRLERMKGIGRVIDSIHNA
jgi:hypothetical protein